MEVRLKANYFHPLKEKTKEMSADSIGGCKIDPSKILKIRKDENCTDNCMPTIFSSLFDKSNFKECQDYESHFCALEDLFDYVYGRFECTKPGVEKYFNGTLDVISGMSYANLVEDVDSTLMGDDDERSRTLLVMNWLFDSPYVNDREEVLVYGAVDIVSWIGGAIGIFGGCSIYDLSSQIIDLVFSLISRFSNTNI